MAFANADEFPDGEERWEDPEWVGRLRNQVESDTTGDDEHHGRWMNADPKRREQEWWGALYLFGSISKDELFEHCPWMRGSA